MDVVDRPALDGARVQETGAAFAGFVRTGATIEMKAFTGVSGDAGGYAVPREIDAAIDRALVATSPIRGIAHVVKVGSAGYRKLVTTGGTPSGWAAEAAALCALVGGDANDARNLALACAGCNHAKGRRHDANGAGDHLFGRRHGSRIGHYSDV